MPQKIIDQPELYDAYEIAKSRAKFAWEIGETAWIFCRRNHNVYQVKIANHFLKYIPLGDHKKCYTCTVFKDSRILNHNLTGDYTEEFYEREMYTTKEDAVQLAIAYNQSKADYYLQQIENLKVF